MSIALIDLGYGNIGSIEFAFERLGAPVRRTADADEIASARSVVLPGVGAAGFAMERLRALGLAAMLPRLAQPVLGICLGMQLLFERSQEGGAECLGIIPGTVRKLTPEPLRPVPHMGWSRLDVRADGLGLESGDYVYFAHSYACDDGAHSLAFVDHCRFIPAIVRRANFTGAQFHPERSGKAGARFLKAFLAS